MKMFQIGLEGGRPAAGSIGAAPEWFYKGVGTIVRAHNESLDVPVHGLDGGEEAEIAGIYLIGRRRHAISDRSRAGKRVFRSRDGSRRIICISRRRNCATARWGRSWWSMPSLTTFPAKRPLNAMEKSSGKRSRRVANERCATHWRTWSIITLNTPNIAARATCTSTFSAPTCSASKTACGLKTATLCRFLSRALAGRCGIRFESIVRRTKL